MRRARFRSPIAKMARLSGHLTLEEETELVTRMIAGEQRARDRIILCHTGMVIGLAQRFRKLGMDEEDLVSVGIVGLLEAANRFDPGKGVRFCTYSKLWAKACIQTYLMANHWMVRRSSSSKAKALFFGQGKFSFLITEGNPDVRRQAIKDLAEKMGLSQAYIESWIAAGFNDLQMDHASTGSGGEDGPTLADMLADPAFGPDDLLEAQEEMVLLKDAMEKLKPRERDILEQRWFAGGAQPVAFEKVGTLHGISKERVRQIEVAAIDKLRANLVSA